MWLGNARGNVYSTNHTIYKPFGSRSDRRNFWTYSLDEIGYYDAPASIDYILNHTGQSKLTYVGHSQGSLLFFIMASERPEYQQKIEIMHAIGPAVFLGNTTSPPMLALAPWAKSITVRHCKILNLLNVTPNLIVVTFSDHWQNIEFLFAVSE